jgi:hypothetical protein
MAAMDGSRSIATLLLGSLGRSVLRQCCMCGGAEVGLKIGEASSRSGTNGASSMKLTAKQGVRTVGPLC